MTNEEDAPHSPLSLNNRTLRHVDMIIRDVAEPAEQLGVLYMASVLALRRLLASKQIADRGRRMRVIKEAVNQFDKRLRQFTVPSP